LTIGAGLDHRILVVNNYPLESVWDEVRRGEKPDHHLYGVNHFWKRGYNIKIAPFSLSKQWEALEGMARRSPLPLGSLAQQTWVLKHLRRGDIIYSPCQTESHLLCLGRQMGLVRSPLICVAHHPFHTGRMAGLRKPYINLVVRGSDWYPALSIGLAQQINSGGGRSFRLQWGPDAQYYHPSDDIGSGVIAAGRTGRDFMTFAQGAIQAGIDAEIVCLKGDAPHLKGLPYIHLNEQPRHGYMNYRQLMSLYSRARVLAIPLTAGANLAGLTGLLDALGMGKPVICTRHPLIDLDIEKEGIGLWVEAGDVSGWSRALSFFDQHPEQAHMMGRRARALVDSGFNSDSYASQIMDLFDQAIELQE